MRRKKRFGKPRKQVREHRINDEITGKQARLITDDGAELVSIEEALKRARQADLDLVEIARSKDVPVVKIISYGKFKFEKSKKEKESKKKQKVIQNKEIKMGPKIDVGDFDRKCNLAEEFLSDGDNVKVTMRFRGREMAHTEIGLEKMNEFAERLNEVGHLDRKPQLEGRIMSMVLRPTGKKSKPKSDKDKNDSSEEE